MAGSRRSVGCKGYNMAYKAVGFILLLMIVAATSSSAVGWGDYRREIDDGYTIVRNGAGDGIYHNGSKLAPRDNEHVAKPEYYRVTAKYIFTKHFATVPRNLFEGDQYEDPDLSQPRFYIIEKYKDKVVGPLTLSEFENRSEVRALAPIHWVKSTNPNVGRATIGLIMVLVFAVIFLPIKFWWITLPVMAMLVVWVTGRRRRSRQLPR
jgi:hypothetical protein